MINDSNIKLLESGEQVLKNADCLYTSKDVEKAIINLAVEITETIGKDKPVVLAVMNGGLIPAGMLIPKLNFPLQVDYLHATRYRDQLRGSEIKWVVQESINLKGRTVLIIDDIHDEGITLEIIKNYCLECGAKKVYSSVLVNKVHNRKNSTSADFKGIDVPDRYVFGYGMDYKGILRNAPGIFAIKD